MHGKASPPPWSVITVVVERLRRRWGGSGWAGRDDVLRACPGCRSDGSRCGLARCCRYHHGFELVYLSVKIANDVVQTQLEYYFMVPIECWCRTTDKFTWSGMMHDAWSHIGTDVWYHNIMVLISNILRDLAFREFCTGTKYGSTFTRFSFGESRSGTIAAGTHYYTCKSFVLGHHPCSWSSPLFLVIFFHHEDNSINPQHSFSFQ